MYWYAGEVPYEITLKRQRYDYTSNDLGSLADRLHEIDMDYPDYAISKDGDVFIWFFDGPSGKFESESLSDLESAKIHIETYGRVSVKWRKT